MSPKRKHPVGQHRKNFKQRKSVPQEVIKESTPERQRWATLFNLPSEIWEVIFRYAAPLDYWTYRIFREFERFRLQLDPAYFVQTNVQPDNMLPYAALLDLNDPNLNSSTELFKIPSDQNEESYTFSLYNEFVRNIDRHAQKFEYTGYRHIFIEMEVKNYDFGQSLHNMLKYLHSKRIECSLFMRHTKVQTDLWMRHVLPFDFDKCIESEQILYGDSLLILDEGFTRVMYSRFDGSSSIKRHKFLKYPSDLLINEDSGANAFHGLFLNQKNVVFKKSVQNLQKLEIQQCLDVFKKVDKCLFTNLKILKLLHCVNTKGHTFYLDNLSFPNLKRVEIELCKLIEISGCHFPNLTELFIDEGFNQKHVKSIPSNTNIVNNQLPNLKRLEIRTKRIDQISGNTLNENMELFNFSAMISDEICLGDIPDIISSCESFVFDEKNATTDTISSLVNGFCDLSKLKKLKIVNTGPKGLNYLGNKMFNSLESFEFMGSSITSIPRLKMPSLKVLLLTDSSIETVNIQGMGNLITIVFNTSKRSGNGIIFNDGNPRDSDKKDKNMFIINLRKIPKSSRTSTIDLRIHEARGYSKPYYPPWEKISFIKTFF